jgi:hypothetical protein
MLLNFLITCSGVNKDVLKSCPKSERTKYIGIGATVLITAIMAAISGMFFLAFAFTDREPKVPVLQISKSSIVLFGLLWGALVFNIDRNLIISLRKTGDIKEDFKQARVRFLLAVFIGLVISTPLELKIFNTEITRKIKSENKAEKDSVKNQNYELYKPDIRRSDSVIKVAQIEVDERNARKIKLYEEYIAEADGTGGSKKEGPGILYRDKLSKYEEAFLIVSIANFRLDSLKKVGANLNDSIKNKIAIEEESISKGNGVATMISALYRTSWAHWFITILFIIIEILPIFTKIISKRGPYDYKLESQDHKVYVEEQVKNSAVNDDANNELEVIRQTNEKKKNNKIQVETIRLDKELKQNEELVILIAEKNKILAKKALEKLFKEKMEI